MEENEEIKKTSEISEIEDNEILGENEIQLIGLKE